MPASCGAGGSEKTQAVPKHKSDAQVSAQKAKRAKQAHKKSVRAILTKELQREPTEQEVLDRIGSEKHLSDAEVHSSGAESAKGSSQPKRVDKEVTYHGTLGGQKVAGAGGSASSSGAGGITDKKDPLFFPWTLVQHAKEALKENPELAKEVFKVNENEDDSEGSSGAEDAPKNRLSCCRARECGNDDLKWSKFLLVEGDADWQGWLWGVCHPCSEMDWPAFKKLARQRKDLRSFHLRGKRERARCITMQNCREVVARMFPKASQKIKRELAIMRTAALLSAGTKILDRMTAEEKVATDENCQQWLKRVEEMAEDPSMSCSVDARTLTATECSYLTRIADGWYISFICRMPTCMFFGMNDALTWVQEINKWGEFSDSHFRCPRCGEEYKCSSTA